MTIPVIVLAGLLVAVGFVIGITVTCMIGIALEKRYSARLDRELIIAEMALEQMETFDITAAQARKNADIIVNRIP